MHRPVFLVPYLEYDGPYANQTDCEYLSLGWAQYGPPPTASLKAFRYTGTKWSRQSEELPLHRAVDLVLLLAAALEGVRGSELRPLNFPRGTFEHQSADLQLRVGAKDKLEQRAFAKQMTDECVLNRLRKLREVLNRMQI
jgi:Family of unknown function (DUF6530)